MSLIFIPALFSVITTENLSLDAFVSGLLSSDLIVLYCFPGLVLSFVGIVLVSTQKPTKSAFFLLFMVLILLIFIDVLLFSSLVVKVFLIGNVFVLIYLLVIWKNLSRQKKISSEHEESNKKRWVLRILLLFFVMLIFISTVVVNSWRSDWRRSIYYLPLATTISIKLKLYNVAGSYAHEMLLIAAGKENKDNLWNRDNLIHKAHIALGEISLSNGDVDKAKKHLILAATIKGSPQLDSFGSDMRLAAQLLDIGEKDVVLEYLDLCSQFWRDDKITEWEEKIKKGESVNFY